MLYSGEQFDPNLQMQYLRARYYDQNNGRFNRLDPFGGNSDDPQSLHKYAYCHGDAVNMIDPSGKYGVVGTILLIVLSTVLILTMTSFNPKLQKAARGVVFVSDYEVFGATFSLTVTSPYFVISNVKNPEDLVDKAEKFHIETGYYIKDFVLSGHGYKAGVQTKQGTETLPFSEWKYPHDAKHNRVDDTKNLFIPDFSPIQIARLKKLFTKDSMYITYGCASGADEKGLQKTADLLEIPAKGFTGNVRADGCPLYEHGQDWHWNIKQPQ